MHKIIFNCLIIIINKIKIYNSISKYSNSTNPKYIDHIYTYIHIHVDTINTVILKYTSLISLLFTQSIFLFIYCCLFVVCPTFLKIIQLFISIISIYSLILIIYCLFFHSITFFFLSLIYTIILFLIIW